MPVPYHKVSYWRPLKRHLAGCGFGAEHFDALVLANLALQDPSVGFLARHAIRSTIFVLINLDAHRCAQHILSAPVAFTWSGLLHDRTIMKRFRHSLNGSTAEQLQELSRG
jgi:hypothetical protein